MLKIGIMGAAKIVPRFVAGVKESGQAEVTGIAARNKEKAQKAALELEIPQVYDDYASLVKYFTNFIGIKPFFDLGHHR